MHAIRLTSFPVARRKEIYEARWPETRKGGDRKSSKAKSKEHHAPLIPAFTRDTASKADRSTHTVRRQVEIGNAFKDMAEEVAATPIADNQRELLALAKLPAKEQRQVVADLTSGAAKSVKQSRRQRTAR